MSVSDPASPSRNATIELVSAATIELAILAQPRQIDRELDRAPQLRHLAERLAGRDQSQALPDRLRQPLPGSLLRPIDQVGWELHGDLAGGVHVANIPYYILVFNMVSGLEPPDRRSACGRHLLRSQRHSSPELACAACDPKPRLKRALGATSISDQGFSIRNRTSRPARA